MAIATDSLQELGIPQDRLTHQIIGAAMEVHRELGPGLLESAYQACLIHELRDRNIEIQVQPGLPVIYKDVVLETGYRPDLIVENEVVVEIKAVSQLSSVHDAQLMSYLRLTGCNRGLLINFNVELLKNGVKRLSL